MAAYKASSARVEVARLAAPAVLLGVYLSFTTVCIVHKDDISVVQETKQAGSCTVFLCFSEFNQSKGSLARPICGQYVLTNREVHQ